MESENSTKSRLQASRKGFLDWGWPTRITFALSVIAFITAVSGAMLAYRTTQELRAEFDRRTDEISWSFEVHEKFHGAREVSPEVGIIQFIDRGYSIELQKVNYTPSGLELEGFVGNPTTLWVTHLTLDFWAYKPFYLKRDEFMEEDAEDRLFFLQDEIGHAQSQAIPTLGPGLRAPFSVTIPNVAQTKEGLTLTVSFSGERYSYVQ